MPLGKTFWSEAFGMLTDRFGTNWMISLAPKDGNYSAQPS
jgi:PhnB protein